MKYLSMQIESFEMDSSDLGFSQSFFSPRVSRTGKIPDITQELFFHPFYNNYHLFKAVGGSPRRVVWRMHFVIRPHTRFCCHNNYHCSIRLIPDLVPSIRSTSLKFASHPSIHVVLSIYQWATGINLCIVKILSWRNTKTNTIDLITQSNSFIRYVSISTK